MATSTLSKKIAALCVLGVAIVIVWIVARAVTSPVKVSISINAPQTAKNSEQANLPETHSKPTGDANDDAAVVKSLLEITDRGLQTHWLKLLAAERAQSDPAATAAWLLKLPEALDRADAMEEVCRLWAEKDPAKAAEFSINLPSGALRQSALTALFPVWITHDIAAATNWLNKLDSHADYDGVMGVVSTLPILVERRPDVALGWAESITNRDLRKQRIATIASAWLVRDRTSAIDYLQNTQALTAFERATIMEDLGIRP